MTTNATEYLQLYKEALFCLEEGKEQNVDKAIELLTLAAEGGYAKAQYELGNLYKKGEYVVPELDTAVYWLDKAAQQGFSKAEKTLTTDFNNCIYYYREVWYEWCGSNVPESIQKIAYWLEKAANEGGAEAQYLMGEILHYLRKEDESIVWLTKSAEQGFENAIRGLLSHYNHFDFDEDRLLFLECVEKTSYWIEKLSTNFQGYKGYIGFDTKILLAIDEKIKNRIDLSDRLEYKALKMLKDTPVLTRTFTQQWLNEFERHLYLDELKKTFQLLKKITYHKNIYQ